MIELSQDLSFITSAIQVARKALIKGDRKLATNCMRAIQNYLNASYHPLSFYSTKTLYDEGMN